VPLLDIFRCFAGISLVKASISNKDYRRKVEKVRCSRAMLTLSLPVLRLDVDA
jgi:hypothetical protein